MSALFAFSLGLGVAACFGIVWIYLISRSQP